jgi:hypothetical protein
MGLSTDILKRPANDFPNGLRGEPPGPVPPRRYLLLAVLVLCCLVPRVWAAWRWDLLWSDSIVYLRITEALERNDLDTAFHALGLNTYPVLLMWLRRTGLDWTVAGEWWSVLMATLAVLPLFGWIRRQFDDQVAFAGCLLYAIHPKLVGYSPLIMRDPTYWFLFALSLYLTWRAVTELRWWLFLASGVALTLTAYTRYEGWFLLVPLVLWALWRLPAIAGRRTRLVLGTATCLAVIPSLVVLVNVTWLRNHPRWEIGRTAQVTAAWSSLVSRAEQPFTKPAAVPTPAAAAPREEDEGAAARPASPPAAPLCQPHPQAHSSDHLSTLVAGRKQLLRFLKALTYWHAILLAVGLCRWRHVFFRRDQQALFVHNVLLDLSIWLYYVQHHGIDLRYFLPIVITGLPYEGLGLLYLAGAAQAAARRALPRFALGRGAAVAGVLGVVALSGIPDASLSARPVMLQQADLGRWILRHKGPNRTILAPSSCLGLLAYYAHARAIAFPRVPAGVSDTLTEAVRANKPNMVLVWDDVYNRGLYAMRSEVARQCLELGYERVSEDQLPASCARVQLFAVPEPVPKTAGKPAPHSPTGRL